MRISKSIVALVVLLAACGGDSGSTTGPNNNGNNNAATGDGNITMTVNGVAWRSAKSTDRVNKSGQFYGIGAFNTPYAFVLGIGNVTGPATFSLNLANGNGSSAIVSNSTSGWGTAFTGGTGTVTVTVLTATRIAGTFSFDAVPGSGAATGTMQVRNGAFDLTF